MKNKIAIITARGGSKRIPGKNIKDFLGKPIIAYSIEAALKSDLFDEVMVSTDDEEIVEISKKYGANIPFLRSKETSNDFATTAEVLIEVINDYKKTGKEFEYGCCIYPTAPFINSTVLSDSFKKIIDGKSDSLIPVVRYSYPVQRALRINDNNLLEFISGENKNKRSQDLEAAYHDAGQFYWFKINRFLETKSLFSDKTTFIKIPESECQDIDNEEDWKIAELKYSLILKEETINKHR